MSRFRVEYETRPSCCAPHRSSPSYSCQDLMKAVMAGRARRILVGCHWIKACCLALTYKWNEMVTLKPLLPQWRLEDPSLVFPRLSVVISLLQLDFDHRDCCGPVKVLSAACLGFDQVMNPCGISDVEHRFFHTLSCMSRIDTSIQAELVIM